MEPYEYIYFLVAFIPGILPVPQELQMSLQYEPKKLDATMFQISVLKEAKVRRKLQEVYYYLKLLCIRVTLTSNVAILPSTLPFVK